MSGNDGTRARMTGEGYAGRCLQNATLTVTTADNGDGVCDDNVTIAVIVTLMVTTTMMISVITMMTLVEKI